MKSKSTTTAKIVSVESQRAIRDYVLHQDDVDVAEVQAASKETDGFGNMFRSVRSINSLIEMLYHVATIAEESDGEEVNWSPIRQALQHAREEQMGSIYSATSRLSEMERIAGLEALKREVIGSTGRQR